jgi:glycosyltransferase involved in cell wall biosynthesis
LSSAPLMPGLWNELPDASTSEETRPLPTSSISVVIPTRDRPQALGRCLRALNAQTISLELEVIVVDDGSFAGGAVAEVVRQYRFARLIRQPASGPATARNVGVASACGSVVCLTDDDCEPEAAWAESLARAIHSGADAAAGRTLSGDSDSALAAASELIAAAPMWIAGPPAEELSFAASNNLACRRDVLTALPFDEGYGRAAGEDRDWCSRLRAAGYALRAEPAATLVHRPELTFRAFFRQQLRYGRGAFRFRSTRTARRLERPSFYALLVRRSFREGARVGCLVCVGQVVTAMGFIAEWRSSRSSPEEVPPRTSRNSRHTHEVMQDVKWNRAERESASALPQKHTVERMIEHQD